MEIFKFVFTGGPCAGKTTIIDKVKELLEIHDMHVFLLYFFT